MVEGRAEVLPLASLKDADAVYDKDPRDQTTPVDMLRLLQLIWQRKAGLSEESTKALLQIMRGCRTGKGRLPGRMAEYVLQENRIMHKTGSIGGRTNNVGFVELPESKGVIAIAAFIKGPAGLGQKSMGEVYAARDRVIADLVRTCYDYYLFQEDLKPAEGK